MLETILSIVLTSLLSLVLLAFYIHRTLPSILEDVAVGAGVSITEKLKETFESPTVKRAMSILGKNSGSVRADKALRNKAASAVLDQSPLIKMGLDKFGISPLEGIQLMEDPLFGPMIKNFIGGMSKEKGSGSRSNNGHATGRM